MSSAKIRKAAETASLMSNWQSATEYLHRELDQKFWDMAEANLAIYLPSALVEIESKEQRSAWLATIPPKYRDTVKHFTRHIWRSRKTSKKVTLQKSLF